VEPSSATRPRSPGEPAGAIDDPSGTSVEPSVESAASEPSAPPRQRWRLVLARSPSESVGASGLGGRELADAWDTALEGSGLPLHRAAGRARARVAFGAPLTSGMAAERELGDISLTDFLPTWQVRAALVGVLPVDWRLIDLHDVWLGAPPLAGQVAAADYRIDLDDEDPHAVAIAAELLMAADSLQRERPKGGATVSYDLRPLLAAVAVADPGPPLLVRARTRFHPVLGTGRPEEVVAALGEVLGRSLTPRSIVRERLILADELG
jgi:hypothetical protein